MNKVISITGPSGVGKTTISKIIAVCLGYQDTIIVSGDDAHIWERTDENWKFTTHLNPTANNLKKEFEQLSDLKLNKQIKRKFYNHSTGKFTENNLVTPKRNIIYEGLHSMYGNLADLSDISFYIDVEKSLKNEWKISRDSKKRGYSIDQIVRAIENRKDDERKYIEPQKDLCDIVLKFRKNKGKINISFDYDNPKFVPLVNKIKKLYNLLEQFITISGKISENEYLSQNKGGNLSFKYEDTIIITESGSSFDKINYFEGFGFYDKQGKSIFPGQNRPSMEVGCHLKLGKCCLHTHPLHVLAILCSQQSEEIIKELFPNSVFLEYVPPGPALARVLVNHENIFLKNHGIFISKDNIDQCLEQSLEIDKKCQQFLLKHEKKNNFLFPDAFVLKDENRLYHAYVESLIQKANLNPSYLEEDQITTLDNMEEEKYRSSLK